MGKKYFCDLCDVFLQRDSAHGRKEHNHGYKHRDVFRAHYGRIAEEVRRAAGPPRPWAAYGQPPPGWFPPPYGPPHGGPGAWGVPPSMHSGGAAWGALPPPMMPPWAGAMGMPAHFHQPGMMAPPMSHLQPAPPGFITPAMIAESGGAGAVAGSAAAAAGSPAAAGSAAGADVAAPVPLVAAIPPAGAAPPRGPNGFLAFPPPGAPLPPFSHPIII
jgi:U1 small nuclear ribonucleoprotein C